MFFRLFVSTLFVTTLLAASNALMYLNDESKIRALRGSSIAPAAMEFYQTDTLNESGENHRNMQSEDRNKRRLNDFSHQPEFSDIAVHQMPSDKGFGGGPALAIIAVVAASFILVDCLIRQYFEN
ncbi:uncharacterized protein PHALS_09156 [Plasmopara halstedii]|uniref:RxLR-like protein n=1 Tax=Plasmopara halstedii TaxID=4781 RepID=A0A0P1ADT1_PLAHL|nr:uncharacterized protein PHALS_09156 [Plasmopara halstedii]CEG39097.1 hypothetical protein PHALS_09156 [Plasmopara halstedii]|eukprot:XP_024575466.1 hypothetical protein PHALS_09156 [Plasmopara halstedii]